MNTDLEVIDKYMNNQLSADDRRQFETALRTDPTIAEALAFYILAKETARSEAHNQRKAELDALRNRANTLAVERPLWGSTRLWAAAASVALLLGLGWYFFGRTTGPSDPSRVAINTDAIQYADDYLSKNFDQLTITMGGRATHDPITDSLQRGIQLFNDRRLPEAEASFRQVLSQQPANDRALKYAGIVALRRGNYDSAIDQFHRLSERTDLFANPGLFLEAIAHLKRDLPMDKEQAKKLLTEVVNSNFEGKLAAQQLLNRLN